MMNSIANDLEKAASWGVDVRLPPALARAVIRLSRYTPFESDIGEALNPESSTQVALAPTSTPDRLTGPTEGVKGGPVGTDLVIRLMRESPPVWTISDLMKAMRAEGWDTNSPSPRGVVANTLGKARVRHPEIERGPKRGTYRWVPDHQLSSDRRRPSTISRWSPSRSPRMRRWR